MMPTESWFEKAAKAAGKGSNVVLGDLAIGPHTKGEMIQEGAHIVGMSAVLGAGKTLLSESAWQGYYLGVAFMHYRSVNVKALMTAREGLEPEERKGFDLALAAYIGFAKAMPTFAGEPAFGIDFGDFGANKPSAALTISRFNDIMGNISKAAAEKSVPRPAPRPSTSTPAPTVLMRKPMVLAALKPSGISMLNAKPVESDAGSMMGYLVTQGLEGAAEPQKVAIMQSMATVPETRMGATAAVKQIAESKKSLWHKILEFLGIK